MSTWEIIIDEGSNGKMVTSTVNAPNENYNKYNVETYPKEGASIPEAVVSYLESRDALTAIVQVMFIENAPGGSGSSTMLITTAESNMEWEDVNSSLQNGVVVVFHQSNASVMTHKKTNGKVKLGDKEE